jgi:hypothetical protein
MKAHAVRYMREMVSATGPSRRWLIREGRQVVVATVRHAARLWRYAHAITSTPLLRLRGWLTQSALGRRMYETGLGDEILRERIAALEERIGGEEATKGWTKASGAERARLYHRLADTAVIQETAPLGDRGEHRRAAAARRRLAECRTRVAAVRGELSTAPRVDRLTAGVAFATLGIVALVLLRAWGAPKAGGIAPPPQHGAGTRRDDARHGPHGVPVAADDAGSSGDAIAAADAPLSPPIPHAAQPRGSVEADDEAIVAEAIRTTSDTYMERGFNQFKFGMSRAVVAAVTPLGDLRGKPGWMSDGKQQGFFFADDRLVAISKRYVGDASTNFAVTEYFDKLLERFGRTTQENITTYKTKPVVSRDHTGDVASMWSEGLMARYSFPEALVYIEVQARCDARGRLGLHRRESITLQIYDRSWVAAKLGRDVRAKRETCRWIRGLIEADLFDKADVAEITTPPGTRLSWTGGEIWLRRRDDDHHVMVAKQEAERKSLTFQFDYLPGYEIGGMNQNLTRAEIVRVNSLLAQEVFPPKGRTIKVQNDVELFKNYEWSTLVGWRVRAMNNVLYLSQEPDKEL